MRESNELLELAAAGDRQALGELFDVHRPRLERMVQVRLDRRLRGRIDVADVMQEAFLDVLRRLPEYVQGSSPDFFLWLRLIALQRLVDLQRRHLGAKMRDAGREVSLYRDDPGCASSLSLAEQLMGHLTTASQAAIRAEAQFQVQEALNRMDPIDREILVLRHFEMLTNEEAAKVLNLRPSATSNRHLRALRRLKEIVGYIPGFGSSLPGEASKGSKRL